MASKTGDEEEGGQDMGEEEGGNDAGFQAALKQRESKTTSALGQCVAVHVACFVFVDRKQGKTQGCSARCAC